MSSKTLTLFLLIILPLCYCQAQTDFVIQQLQKIPIRYLEATEKKINKYSNRITGKTEKTLVKLSRWENKIQSLLQKVNPETANKLFANNQMTFSAALQKYREGKTIAEGYKASYDQYRDELTTQIKYLEDKKELLDKKYLQPLAKSKEKIYELEKDIQNTEAVQQFIKERKKQLLQEAVKNLGKNKYLQKINKESFYYTETLRNYKEIFSDKKKAEETALTILNKIPAFKKFTQENSMLSSLFGAPGASGSPLGAGGLLGLQTRASVNALIQNQIAAGGPNAQQMIQQNIQQAQAELSELKDKIIKAGGGSNNNEIADFKVNPERSKTLKQRLEFNTNLQFGRKNNLLPATTDIGLSVGYKFSDSKIFGIGISYKVGLGTLQKIQLSHQGISLRSFADIKLKKQFYLTSGYEINFNAAFRGIAVLKEFNSWQSSGLIGLSKKINIQTKYTKGTKLQILYDMLSKQHAPVSQQWIFRVGYKF